MAVTPRENRLRALEFRNPAWIPCSLNTVPLFWWVYGDALSELAERHPKVYLDGELVKPSEDLDTLPADYEPGSTYEDEWGIVWQVGTGTTGPVSIEHPLADWNALASYEPPDPFRPKAEGGRDWEEEAARIADRRERGLLTQGYGGDLFTFMIALRGFENLMIDFATDDPRLEQTLDMLVAHHLPVVQRYIELGVDTIRFHNDLGWQQALAISPTAFRRYLKPRFQQLMWPCREAGVHVVLSSDGYMLDIVDDLVECGVSCHDPQISANTLAGIRDAYKGKMCVKIRLDPQALPFCRPEDVRGMVQEVVEELGAPEGGLWLDTNLCCTDIRMEILEAICLAYEEFCFQPQ
jgi:uroporphyrinogen decarboxylase